MYFQAYVMKTDCESKKKKKTQTPFYIYILFSWPTFVQEDALERWYYFPDIFIIILTFSCVQLFQWDIT